jgi:hypothetical protein
MKSVNKSYLVKTSCHDEAFFFFSKFAEYDFQPFLFGNILFLLFKKFSLKNHFQEEKNFCEKKKKTFFSVDVTQIKIRRLFFFKCSFGLFFTQACNELIFGPLAEKSEDEKSGKNKK